MAGTLATTDKSLLSCPALQLEKPKEKHVRFCHSDRWKARETPEIAKRLANSLRELRGEFPGFASRIDSFIAQVQSDALRSRSYDRERVLGLLRSWPCGLTAKELMEDTGFTHWDVRQILAELMKRELVFERWEVRPGTRVKVYRIV